MDPSHVAMPSARTILRKLQRQHSRRCMQAALTFAKDRVLIKGKLPVALWAHEWEAFRCSIYPTNVWNSVPSLSTKEEWHSTASTKEQRATDDNGESTDDGSLTWFSLLSTSTIIESLSYLTGVGNSAPVVPTPATRVGPS